MWRHEQDAIQAAGRRKDVVVLEVTVPDHLIIEDWEMDSDDDGESCAVRTRFWVPPSAIAPVGK
jgi:hypothetical protein